jgi:hypothetical protein
MSETFERGTQMIDDGEGHFAALHLDPGQTARVGGIKRAFRGITREIEREEGFVIRCARTEMRPGGCGGQSVSESTTAAVHARFAADCHLRGVEVAGTGAYGVWFDDGSADCSITQSLLHDLGAGGVRVGTGADTGSTATAPARNVTVADNEVAASRSPRLAGLGVGSPQGEQRHVGRLTGTSQIRLINGTLNLTGDSGAGVDLQTYVHSTGRSQISVADGE